MIRLKYYNEKKLYFLTYFMKCHFSVKIYNSIYKTEFLDYFELIVIIINNIVLVNEMGLKIH